MMRSLILLALFCTAVSAYKNLEMVIDDGVLLHWYNGESYAIGSDEHMKEKNWLSADVNGDQVRITTEDCKTIEKKVADLQSKDSYLLNYVAERLRSPVDAGDVSFFNLDCRIKNEGFSPSYFHHNDVLLEMISNSHYTMSTPGLTEAGYERVAINGELVTFIHLDYSFEMIPKSCLDAARKSLLEAAEKEIIDAKEDERAAMRQKSGRV